MTTQAITAESADAVLPIFRIGHLVLNSDTAPRPDGMCAMGIRTATTMELSLALTVFELKHGKPLDIVKASHSDWGLAVTAIVPHHLAKRYVGVAHFEEDGIDRPFGVADYPTSDEFNDEWEEVDCEDFAASHPLVKAAMKKAA